MLGKKQNAQLDSKGKGKEKEQQQEGTNSNQDEVMINDLPEDVLLRIFKYLNKKELYSLQLTCSFFKEIIGNNFPELSSSTKMKYVRQEGHEISSLGGEASECNVLVAALKLAIQENDVNRLAALLLANSIANRVKLLNSNQLDKATIDKHNYLILEALTELDQSIVNNLLIETIETRKILSDYINDFGNVNGHYTFLHVAAANGESQQVSRLIELGADIDVKDTYYQKSVSGKTPLMMAAQNRHAETVSVLLKRGASVIIEDICQNTALFYAVAHDVVINSNYLGRWSLSPRFYFGHYNQESNRADIFKDLLGASSLTEEDRSALLKHCNHNNETLLTYLILNMMHNNQTYEPEQFLLVFMLLKYTEIDLTIKSNRRYYEGKTADELIRQLGGAYSSGDVGDNKKQIDSQIEVLTNQISSALASRSSIFGSSSSSPLIANSAAGSSSSSLPEPS